MWGNECEGVASLCRTATAHHSRMMSFRDCRLYRNRKQERARNICISNVNCVPAAAMLLWNPGLKEQAGGESWDLATIQRLANQTRRTRKDKMKWNEAEFRVCGAFTISLATYLGGALTLTFSLAGAGIGFDHLWLVRWGSIFVPCEAGEGSLKMRAEQRLRREKGWMREK